MQHGRTGEVYYEGKCMSFSEPGLSIFYSSRCTLLFHSEWSHQTGGLFNFNLNLIITD